MSDIMESGPVGVPFVNEADEAAIYRVKRGFNWGLGRLRYLVDLVRAGQSVDEIAVMLATDRSTVRRKLGLLRDAGLDIEGAA